jgi:hypothetical protein
VGFLEKVYENALKIELNLRGLKTLQQTPLKVFYKNELVGDYIADILVEDEIIIEVTDSALEGAKHPGMDAHGFDISIGSLIPVFQSRRTYTNQICRIQR